MKIIKIAVAVAIGLLIGVSNITFSIAEADSNTNDTVINDTIQSAPNEISIDMNSIDFEEKTSESVNTNDLFFF